MIENVQPIRFADYDLVHFLGRGGMGEVWSAVKRWELGSGELAKRRPPSFESSRLLADPFALNKPLALKVMHPRLSSDKDYRELFVAETGITMQLSSANIVSVFGIGEHDGLLYMAMERIDGVNLHDFHDRVLTAGGIMPLDIAVHVIHEVLTALFVAHEHTVTGRPAGIIHRDIKPGNVLVSSVGDVLLTDFGIARPVSRDATVRTGLAGTLRYMAPEQARGLASKASDLFAVGAVFHELLTGRRFRDECRTDEDLAAEILGKPSIPPVERTLPTELEYLRRKLLDPDPSERVASAREALSLLSSWSGRGSVRVKIAELYEQVVGARSSGFTRAHQAALPSFLLERRERLESDLTVPALRRPARLPPGEAHAGPPRKAVAAPDDDTQKAPRREAAAIGEEDETSTYDKMPWLVDEPSASQAEDRPDTNAPVGPHGRRVVPAPSPAAQSKPRAPAPAAEPLTPTELLGSVVGPPTAEEPSTVPPVTSAAAPGPELEVPRDRERGAAAGIIGAAARTLSRRQPYTTAQRVMVVALITLSVFLAGLVTAWMVAPAPPPAAPRPEASP